MTMKVRLEGEFRLGELEHVIRGNITIFGQRMVEDGAVAKWTSRKNPRIYTMTKSRGKKTKG